MTTTREIVGWAEELRGRRLTHEEGIHHGSPDAPVTGATVCWKAIPAAIEAAGKRGDQLIIGHESLYYPYYFDFDPDRTLGWQEWEINKRKKAQLERYGLTYLRLHSTIDQLYIPADMGAWLELGEPTVAESGALVWQIPECTLRELADRAKRVSGLAGLRVTAPKGMGQKVRRVGLLTGGAGLCPNGSAFEPGVRAGCDVLIGGETDNYGFLYAAECGIALIETSHEVCENPGIRHFVRVLAAKYPDLRITFFENTCPYEIY